MKITHLFHLEHTPALDSQIKEASENLLSFSRKGGNKMVRCVTSKMVPFCRNLSYHVPNVISCKSMFYKSIHSFDHGRGEDLKKQYLREKINLIKFIEKLRNLSCDPANGMDGSLRT